MRWIDPVTPGGPEPEHPTPILELTRDRHGRRHRPRPRRLSTVDPHDDRRNLHARTTARGRSQSSALAARRDRADPRDRRARCATPTHVAESYWGDQSTSAICTAFSAAPLRRLSPVTQRLIEPGSRRVFAEAADEHRVDARAPRAASGSRRRRRRAARRARRAAARPPRPSSSGGGTQRSPTSRGRRTRGRART